MKIYVHLDLGGPLTCACNVSRDDVSFATFKQALTDRLVTAFPAFTSSTLKICRKNKKELECPDDTKATQLFENNEEIFATFVASPAVVKETSVKECPKPKVEDVKKKAVKIDSKDDVESSSPKTVGDWIKIAKRWQKAGQANKSVEIYKALLLAQCPTQEVYDSLVQIYLDAERPKVALKYVKKAKKDFPENLEYLLREGECYLASTQGDKALEVYMDASKKIRGSKHASVALKHEIQTGMCKAYQLKDQRDMALVLIQAVVGENRQNLPAMLEYAKLTYDLGDLQASEAAVILLTCLVQSREDSYRQRTLTEVCQKPNGVKHLLNAMEDAKSDPAALAFLATVLRDNGALDESIELLEMALKHKPDHVNIFLNYIHTLEVVNKHEDIVQKMITFLERFSEIGVGIVTNQRIVKCIEHLKDCTAYLNVKQGAVVEEEERIEQIVTSYSEDDLYLLALWFTLVKVLYIRGTLGALPALVALLDPLYKDKDLHKTLIKNEAAYYGCVSQVVSTWTSRDKPGCDVPVLPSSGKYVYMVGDSHCVSPAWRTIQHQGEARVLHPVLSTGTKIWHLRLAGVFYPKHNWRSATAHVPDGATVVCVLGEIDCREGLHLCVQKCKYETLEEGIEALLEIYVTVLQEMRAKNKWQMYVHPVPPVLDVTRPTVLKFNTMLKKRLERESDIHYMDFLPDLCDGQGNLSKDMEFDGTHLHPSYTSVLERYL